MIRSMTGYGKAEADLPSGKLTVEIRTLNSKTCEISLKTSLLPKERELPVRQKLASSLQRGTIDLFLTWQPNASEAARRISPEVVREYAGQIEAIFGPAASREAVMTSVLGFPEIFEYRKEVIDGDSWPSVERAIGEAAAAVNEFREREGATLYQDVTSRVQKILALYDEVERLEPERVEAVKTKLRRNLEELQAKADPLRFEQELIFYLEKYDINEERVRLREHCKYFMETIDTDPSPGKKLGFIIQEMGREINTTGSKANHAGIQKIVVRMKDELEKIREQCLNIL